MPSRTVTLLVFALWLATLGWMLYRDRLPGDDQPPPFKFELMDEVRGNNNTHKLVHWDMTFRMPNGREDVSVCTTSMVYKHARLFELESGYNLQDDTKPWFFGSFRVAELRGAYRVAAVRGEIVGVSTVLKLKNANTEFQFQCDVKADAWSHEPAWELRPQGDDRPPTAAAPSLRGAFNPVHPRPTLPGLHAGRTWGVTVIDPLENARRRVGPTGRVFTSAWQAVVGEAALEFEEKAFIPLKKMMKRPGALKGEPGFGPPFRPGLHKAELPPFLKEPEPTAVKTMYDCWRVDCTDQTGVVRARIWVRREDDWVLRQEVYYPEGTLKLQRQTGKHP